MPFIKVRDIRMYYEIHGTGPRLLFINGTGGDLRRKPNIFESPLIEQFETLAHDQRGLGQTDRPDVPYTMEDYAMDVDALLEAVGWESCNVLGVSFGGMVAQEFALRYPHRVQRLVLACTSSGGAGGDSYPLHKFGDLPPRERALRVMPLSDTRLDAAWQAANQKQLQEMVEQTLEGAAVGADEPGRKVGAHRQLEARKGHNVYDRLPALKMPVFICGGRYDGIAPVANLEAIRRQIPHAHLELFDGGHLFVRQDARAFERIAGFLNDELDG
jgi:3-oxoadipate enol-lactonase